MRWRPWMWLTLSMACFLAAVYLWQLGDRWAAAKSANRAPKETNQIQPADPPIKPATHSRATPTPLHLLSEVGHVNSPSLPAKIKTNDTSRLTYRLTNTTKSLATLAHSESAVLLENALIDTAKPGAPAIPESLRSSGDPGSY